MFLKDENSNQIPFSDSLVGFGGNNQMLQEKSFGPVMNFLNVHKHHILYALVILVVLVLVKKYLLKKRS